MSNYAARLPFIVILSSLLLLYSPFVRPSAVAQDAPSKTAETPPGGDASHLAGSASLAGAARASQATTAVPRPQTTAPGAPAGPAPIAGSSPSVQQSPEASSTSVQSSSGNEYAKIPRSLRASEVMALQAGGALPANLVYDLTARGLSFHPDADFMSLMTKAGADGSVIEALKAAKVNDQGAAKPEMELLRQLADAAVLMNHKQYAEAGAKLADALDASFARLETGFVMAELLRQQKDFATARAVYGQILETEPDFPEAHDKASYVLYRLEDDGDAINEAKAALALNPSDAEAHKNEALALSQDRRYDRAAEEFKQALRLKPDYAAARSGLGLVYARMQDYPSAIVEYRKAIALDPDYDDAHNNLGLAYKEMGNIGGAVGEFRQAKRLSPNFPDFRQNLASALMEVAPAAAIEELKELEAKFPTFEVCHVCLGNGLMWENEVKEAEAEFEMAVKLDPSDPDPHRGLGDIRQKQKNYEAALAEYRIAERLAPDDAAAYESAGKLLLEKKDYDGAVAELKRAEPLAQSNWEVHEMCGKALLADGKAELAVAEFKEAIALDPHQGQVMTEFGEALEKEGDWVGALEQYRKGALSEANRVAKMRAGQSYRVWEKDPQKEYRLAKARFNDYLLSLKAAGNKDEATELKKRVATLTNSGSMRQKMLEAMRAGDEAIKERRMDEAVTSFQQAVALGHKLPPGDENLIVALGRLGNAYAFQQNYAQAEEAFHQELKIIEKTFGPNYPRVTDPLFYLGSMAAGRKDYAAAEGYFSRALAVNLKSFGEKSTRTSESLRTMAGLYMAQADWAKAEPFLLRALKASEAAAGPDDNLTLVPLYGLCDLYDRWEKPDQSQPCWQRAIGIMEKRVGENSPDLREPLTAEAKALRKLGKNDLAGDIEQRLDKIQKMAASN
jgi:tetratricopeptide (TPR) repeat protein